MAKRQLGRIGRIGLPKQRRSPEAEPARAYRRGIPILAGFCQEIRRNLQVLAGFLFAVAETKAELPAGVVRVALAQLAREAGGCLGVAALARWAGRVCLTGAAGTRCVR